MKQLKLFFIAILLYAVVPLVAQSSTAPCNEYSPLITDTYSTLTVNSSQLLSVDHFSNKNNLIDTDLDNSSSWTAVVGGSAWIEVKDNNAIGADVYPVGSYAGFVLTEIDILSLGGGLTITTFLGSTEQEVKSTGDVLGTLLSGEKRRVGFVTTKSFDRVRLTVNAGLTLVFTTNVHYAEIFKPCATAALDCNMATPLVQPTHGAVIEDSRSGFEGIAVGAFLNPENVVNADLDDYATLSLNVGVLASASVSVRDLEETFPAGHFAGFEISNANILALEILNTSQIRTYLKGELQETSNSSTLLLEVPLLSGNQRQTVGFVTTQPFDEIRFTINQPVGLDLGATRVYYAVAKKYCAGPELECNTDTFITNPEHPVDINSARTGVFGAVCVGCNVSNPQNVIDTDPSNYATMDLVAGVGYSTALSVKNGYESYPANTYAGFDIQNPNILDVELLGAISIELYNDGNLVQTGTGSGQIINGDLGILLGSNRAVYGIVANQEFDEVRLVAGNTAQISLGTTLVYGLVIKKGCLVDFDCETSTPLTSPEYPVVIEGSRTGIISGVACVGCEVQNAQNVISNDNQTGRIQLAVGALGASGAISIRDIYQTYPIGTTTGFIIKDANPILEVGLLNAITIKTYLDGIEQESKIGSGQVLDLDLILPLLGSGSDEHVVGFVATKPFNEIRIIYTSIAANVLTFLDVKNAFVDASNVNEPGLNCGASMYAVNDINQIPSNKTAIGNILTNDHGVGLSVQSATYLDAVGNEQPLPLGTATNIYADNESLAGALTLNVDGSYTFVPSAEFVGNVPMNYTAVDGNGTTSSASLEITVIPSVNPQENNPPIAQNDTGFTHVNVPLVNANVLSNDSDPEGENLIVTGALQNGASIPLGTPFQVSGEDLNGNSVSNTGVLTMNADGSYNFVPASGFEGTIDQIIYTISDGNGGMDDAKLFISVLEVNGNTTFANDDANTAPKGEAMSGNVLDNDTDPEGNTQTVTGANVGGTALTIGTATVLPGVGTITLNADGSYTFVPEPTYVGTTNVVYTICDDGTQQACDTATLYLTSLDLMACYKPGNFAAGSGLPTNVGVTSLRMTNTDNWPQVRQGAWIALESKTKGFVPNRLTTEQIAVIPGANLVVGMMVYNITEDCLQINVDGTATGWKCFTVESCD